MKVLSSVALALTVAGPVNATTLNFDTATCDGGGTCGDNSLLDQSHGDVTGLDIVYDGDTGTTGLQNVLYWSAGYESFDSVIWTAPGKTLSILFDVLAGYTLNITAINFAPYLDNSVSTQITVTDTTDDTVEASGTYVPLGTDNISTIAGLFSSTDGLLISFGPDAYNAGIGSIEYTLTPTAAVPLPAALPLLLVALGGLGIAGRRRPRL